MSESSQTRASGGTGPTRVALKAQSFFVASPGDVRDEREALKLWLEPKLQNEGHQLYAYEYDTDTKFHAGATFQDQIPYPSDDLARATICLLGERLGGDVGDGFQFPEGFEKWLAEWHRPLGSPISMPGAAEAPDKIPLTGTLFELLDALRAAERDPDRRVWIFVKGTAATSPQRPWSSNPRLEDVPLGRKFGASTEYDRLNELAKSGGVGAAEAEAFLAGEYKKQLSYVDAVLRILRQKSKSVETFFRVADLKEKLRGHVQAYFSSHAPSDAEPWSPSLEAIDSSHAQSLFGRTREVRAICNRLIELSLPDEDGRPWIVLPGVSGAGKSSLARGGVAAKFRGGWRSGAQVFTLETSPSELRDSRRAPVMELATRLRAVLGDPAFPGDGAQAAWDRCIDTGADVDPAEVAALIVSLVKTEVGRQTRYALIVMDQAEEWWDGAGKFIDANRSMLTFLDHLTRSKVISCLTVLQSEPVKSDSFGGKLQSLRMLGEFAKANTFAKVDIERALSPPATLGDIREIVMGVVREQVGQAPDGLEALVDQAGSLLEAEMPFLPLLAIRLKRICDAFRAQNLDDGVRARGTAAVPTSARMGADDPFVELGDEVKFVVEPWMVEALTDELDALGEMAIGDIPALKRDAAALDAALDLCLTKLVGVASDDAERVLRSDSCVRIDHDASQFGQAESTERVLVDCLIRRRLVRHTGKVLRLTHLSVIDNWDRARRWFDSTAVRRVAAERVATLLAPAATVASIGENLRDAKNWQALRQILHHVAQESPLISDKVLNRKSDLLAAMEVSFERLADDPAQQNNRLNEALTAGLRDFVKVVLSRPGVSVRLDSDTSPAAAEPLLVRLARSGLLASVELAAKEGCRRAALSPRTRESVFSLLLERVDVDGDDALRLFSVLQHGDPNDRTSGGKPRPAPLKGVERSAVFDVRTKKDQKSLLDYAAMSGSGKAVKLVLGLEPEEKTRRELIDPHAQGATRTLKSPLFLAVEAGKRPAVDALLSEARKLLKEADLSRYVNSMPARASNRQRREPAIVSAARSGSVEIVNALLAVGADPTKAGSDLCDAFQVALLRDDTKVLGALLGSGATPSQTGSGFSLAHWAAVLNATKCLSTLIARELDAPSLDAVGRNALHVACARSRVDAVKAVVATLPKKKRELWMGAKDNRGQSLLHLALRAGRLDTVELLLQSPIVTRFINEADASGYRPLHYAARFCGANGVALLCAKGAERVFDLTPPAEITVLQVAAMMNDADACAMLMTDLSMTQRNPHQRTALHYAARHGSAEAMAQLLSVASPLDAKNAEGQTALHLAAYGGHGDCVALLLPASAERGLLDATDDVLEGGRGGRTPLWSATTAGHAGVARQLIEAGADVERASATTLRPLDEACRKGHTEVARTLIEARADVGPGWLNHTPLHYACRGGHLDCFDLVGAVLMKASPNALTEALRMRTQFGDTPLQALAKSLVRSAAPMRLSEYQREEGYFGEGADSNASAQLLSFRLGDDSSVLDLKGAAAIVKRALPMLTEALDEKTVNDLALGCAVLADPEVVQRLWSAGVRFNKVRDQFGGTPLHLAAKSGAIGVLEALVTAGADVNAQAADGGTVLHTLVLHTNAVDFARGLRALMAAGAPVDAIDVFGESVLHKIAACKSPDLVEKCKTLCDAGANIDLQNADGETPRGVLAFVRRKMATSDRDDLKEEIEILDQELTTRGAQLSERTASEARLPRVAYPVHTAIMAARWDLVPKIVKYGAGHCAVAADPNGRTPLMALASTSWSAKHSAAMGSLFDWLLSQSEDLDVRDVTGRSVAHYSCLAVEEKKGRLIGAAAALERLPADVDLAARDGLGRIPLHAAAAVGNLQAIAWLSRHGQKPDTPDAIGNLPAHLAAQTGQSAAYEALNALTDTVSTDNAVGITPAEIKRRKTGRIPSRSELPMGSQAVASANDGAEKKKSAAIGWIAVAVIVVAVVLGIVAAFAFMPSLRDLLLSFVGR